MPKFHSPFTLYKRRMKDGRAVWYFRHYFNGRRMSGKRQMIHTPLGRGTSEGELLEVCLVQVMRGQCQVVLSALREGQLGEQVA